MNTSSLIRITPEQFNLNDRCNLLFHIDKNSTAITKLAHLAKSLGFWEKEETHLTIIGSVVGKFIKEASLTDDRLLENIINLLNQFEWNLIPKEEYYKIEKTYIQKTGFKEKRESIIQIVEIPVIEDFYKKLNELLGTDFETPFTHVTLYIKSNYDKQKEGIGIASEKDFYALNPQVISANTKSLEQTLTKERKLHKVKIIQLPTRPQVDTLITLYIIETFGQKEFDGVSKAKIVISPLLPEGETFETLLEKGTLCVDVGQGPFDHHGNNNITSAEKAARYFGQEKNPALGKLLELALRSENGKGTISQDALDKMFGFDGMVMTLNKTYQNDPKNVLDLTKGIIDAYYKEAYKRTVEYPKLFAGITKEGKGEIFNLKLGNHQFQTCIMETTDSGFISFLRAYGGGKCEIVIQHMPSGHINILTRMNNGIDLSKLAYLVRSSELILQGQSTQDIEDDLMAPNRIVSVPEWYYDKVTNSILNGGIHPQGVKPTKLSKENIKNLVLKWQEIY